MTSILIAGLQLGARKDEPRVVIEPGIEKLPPVPRYVSFLCVTFVVITKLANASSGKITLLLLDDTLVV